MSAQGIRSIGDDATPEAKLTFLLDEAVQTQMRLNALGQEVRDARAETRDVVRTLKLEFQDELQDALTQERAAYLRERAIGVLCLVTGTPILLVTSIVSVVQS